MTTDHDRRWPWCPHGDAPHTHTDRLNGPPEVDGKPAGPQVLARIVPTGWHHNPETNTVTIDVGDLPPEVVESVRAGILRGVSVDVQHMTIDVPRPPARRGPDLGEISAGRVQDAEERRAAERLAPVLAGFVEQQRAAEEQRRDRLVEFLRIREDVALALRFPRS